LSPDSSPIFAVIPPMDRIIEAIEAEIQRLQAALALLAGDTNSAQSGQARDGAEECGHRTLSRFWEDATWIDPYDLITPYRCPKYEPEQTVEVGQPKLPNAQPLCHRMAAAENPAS
jgi:hypothetical protein